MLLGSLPSCRVVCSCLIVSSVCCVCHSAVFLKEKSPHFFYGRPLLLLLSGASVWWHCWCVLVPSSYFQNLSHACFWCFLLWLVCCELLPVAEAVYCVMRSMENAVLTLPWEVSWTCCLEKTLPWGTSFSISMWTLCRLNAVLLVCCCTPHFHYSPLYVGWIAHYFLLIGACRAVPFNENSLPHFTSVHLSSG